MNKNSNNNDDHQHHRGSLSPSNPKHPKHKKTKSSSSASMISSGSPTRSSLNNMNSSSASSIFRTRPDPISKSNYRRSKTTGSTSEFYDATAANELAKSKTYMAGQSSSSSSYPAATATSPKSKNHLRPSFSSSTTNANNSRRALIRTFMESNNSNITNWNTNGDPSETGASHNYSHIKGKIEKNRTSSIRKNKYNIPKSEWQLLQTIGANSQHTKKSTYTFQTPVDRMNVLVKTVELSSRTAFEERKRIQSLLEQLQKLNNVSPKNSTSNNKYTNKKISPSLLHVQILNKLYTLPSARQLCWFPSVSPEATPFHYNDQRNPSHDNANNSNENHVGKEDGFLTNSSVIKRSGSNRRSKKSKHNYDRSKIMGGHKPMDPVIYINTILRNIPPPRITHTKQRLPMRTDVGFPNATEDEINLKQLEIIKEADWEQTSPRLIVLLTTINYFDHLPQKNTNYSKQEKNCMIHPQIFQKQFQHRSRSSTFLADIPFASKELCKYHDCHQFFLSRQSHGNDNLISSTISGHICEDEAYSTSLKKVKNVDTKRKLNQDGGKCIDSNYNGIEPNPASVFAPPVDATFSSKLMWRARPFADRPAGMRHILAAPLDVCFDTMDGVEPLICSLALYQLDSSGKLNSKLSEDICIPAGNWNGLLHEEAAHILSKQFSTSSKNNKKSYDKNDSSQSWRIRKKKAIFAYDPLAMTPPLSTSSLYVVMQVNKVTQLNAAGAYIVNRYKSSSSNQTSTKKKGGFGKLLSKSLKKHTQTDKKKNMQETFHNGDFNHLKDSHVQDAKSAYDTFGTQFLTPICFGLIPAFGKNNNRNNLKWPDGIEQTMKLFAYPSDRPESHEEFMQRLSSMTNHDGDNCFFSLNTKTVDSSEVAINIQNYPPRSPQHRATSAESSNVSKGSVTSSYNNNIKNNSSKSRLSPISSEESTSKLSPSLPPFQSNGFTMVNGHATFYTSDLGIDFTQVLLNSPESLKLDNKNNTASGKSNLPRLLVDVSGDCAIMIHPDNNNDDSAPISNSHKKRSNLIRLPPSVKPCGYLDSFEAKEVLYFPPRLDRQFDADIPLCSTTLLNLLYVYPRLLRFMPSKNTNNQSGNEQLESFADKRGIYSIRIRLVQQGIEVDDQTGAMETVYTPTQSIHNPSPGSPSLLTAMYTKIPSCTTIKNYVSNIVMLEGKNKEGVPFSDEVKLRLPMVLDGSFFIQFTLYLIELEDGGNMIQNPLAETMIPLSTTRTKELTTGSRVATIIPNGLHRIKLGSYVLQLETRLASTIHVSDTAVATVLRDFPFFADDTLLNPTLEKSLSSQSSATKKSTTVSFSNVLSNASQEAVVSHFAPLICIYLGRIIQPPRSSFDFYGNDRHVNSSFHQKWAPWMDNMACIFEVLNKTKEKFEDQTATGHQRIGRFLKDFFDVFDEQFLYPTTSSKSDSFSSIEEKQRLTLSTSSQSMDVLLEKSADASEQDMDLLSEIALKVIEEKLLEGAALIAIQQEYARSSISDERSIVRSYSNISNIGAPFSRKAYGASKTDRMKAEAEFLYETGQPFSELYDDDETVATASTWQSYGRWSIAGSAQTKGSPTVSPRDYHKNNNTFDQSSHIEHGYPSILRNNVSPSSSTVINTPFERAKSMAKRVNTVANLVIGPCVASSLPIPAPGVKKSKNKSVTIEDNLYLNSPRVISEEQKLNLRKKISTDDSKSNEIFNPGSDVEDEKDVTYKNLNGTISRDFTPFPSAPVGIRLRGHLPSHLFELEFTIKDTSETPSDVSPDEASLTPPYLYEMLMILWLTSCRDDTELSDNSGGYFENSLSKSSQLFIKHIDFFLPLCLKSLVLRCYSKRGKLEIIPSIVLDRKHMQVLDNLSENIARGLLTLGLPKTDDQYISDNALLEVLSLSDSFIEFLIGLFTIIHPCQVAHLVKTYIYNFHRQEKIILQHHEQKIIWEDAKNGSDKDATVKQLLLTQNTVCSLRCQSQLRIRVVEKLATMPRFIALNFLPKYAYLSKRRVVKSASWTNQFEDDFQTTRNEILKIRFPDEIDRSPETHWLATLLANECFSICSNCCEILLNDSFSKSKVSGKDSELIKGKSSIRQRLTLSEEDRTRLQSTSIHAITCVYELLLRWHATDDRFQTEETRGRIAGMFLSSVIENSIQHVNLLEKLESTNKVRCTWLLCILYIMQEAPEIALGEQFYLLCKNKTHENGSSIHRILQVFKLSCLTFQCLNNVGEVKSSGETNLEEITPWLVQESFNTICGAAILLLDECADTVSTTYTEKTRLASEVLDLFLSIVSSPQSSVTLLRCLGGTSHALQKFGALTFLDAVGDNLQSWARMIFTLMNNTSLSVRSMAVDLTVSLLCSVFEEDGNIDHLSLVFLTVLPEVVAREIALYSVGGCVSTVENVECALWPLRRALADVEETNPVDDDRVDPQLTPFLSSLARACQAIIDGVFIELRLRGKDCCIVGTFIDMIPKNLTSPLNASTTISNWAFDADEESLFEAANFFQPETGPMQRIRWLLTLRSLHELKGQWVEAAETLILCARTIADALPHVKNVWRPSRFVLWTDHQISPWLSIVGKENGPSAISNSKVMDFADNFLEPLQVQTFVGTSSQKVGVLDQPSVAALCRMLTAIAKEAFTKYDIESGLELLMFSRLEQLLKNVMGFLDHRPSSTGNYFPRNNTFNRYKSTRPNRTEIAEEITALRKMSAAINELVTKISERMLLLAEEENQTSLIVDEESRKSHLTTSKIKRKNSTTENPENNQYYVRVLLMGKKPKRFEESTTIPTFLEWENPAICRVPKQAVMKALESRGSNHKIVEFDNEICNEFARPYLAALKEDLEKTNVKLYFDIPSEAVLTEGFGKTFLIVTLVRMKEIFFSEKIHPSSIDLNHENYDKIESKRFVFEKINTSGDTQSMPKWVEMTVAKKFPCSLSRQKTLITSEYLAGF